MNLVSGPLGLCGDDGTGSPPAIPQPGGLYSSHVQFSRRCMGPRSNRKRGRARAREGPGQGSDNDTGNEFAMLRFVG